MLLPAGSVNVKVVLKLPALPIDVAYATVSPVSV
ncbi:hypothetical protein [Sulfolobus super-elliptical virus]|nr:hypothetical protein [Sulfolobus super-elliptical virus]